MAQRFEVWAEQRPFSRPSSALDRFSKDLLPAGRILLPDGRVLDSTPTFLAQLAEDTNRWIANGHKVALQDGHDLSALKTVGFAEKLRTTDKGWLNAEVDVPEKSVADRVGVTIKDVSVGIARDVEDEKGNKYGAIVEHIAVTPVPVVGGQRNFERLSRCALSLSTEEDGEFARLAVELQKSQYVNPDGSFVGGFEGCVSWAQDEKGLSEDRARKLCAYIGRQAGKIPASRQGCCTSCGLGLPCSKEKEKAMLAKLKAKLALSADASDDAVLAAVEKLSGPGREGRENLDRVTVLEREVAARDEKVKALELSVKSLNDAQATRRRTDADRYVLEIKTKAAKAGSPIPEEDLKRVTDLLGRDEETGRVLGDAFLARSEAKAGGTGGKAITLTSRSNVGNELQDLILAREGFTRDGNGTLQKKS